MTYTELKNKQIGGTHYKFDIQPWDFYRGGALSREEWVGYLKGNIIDYLVRKKNGLEDLQKAQHLMDVLVATETEITEAEIDERYPVCTPKDRRSPLSSVDRRICFNPAWRNRSGLRKNHGRREGDTTRHTDDYPYPFCPALSGRGIV